jgi:autotransporter-associated beta strand protein
VGGVVNLNSGVINALTIGFGYDSSTYHLNGGTLITATIKNATTTNATASLYFNGTTVQYLTNKTGFQGSFFPYGNVLSANEHAYISSGGVTFVGVTGTNMTFSAPLLHDPALGATADGGLTEAGTGTMTFSAANTYTGPTTINSGTFAITGAGSLTTSGINISNGTLSVSGLGSSATYAMPGASFAAGTNATIIGGAIGTVNLGSLPVTLTYNGTTPALTISQGTLELNNNVFTVNTSSGLPLATGQYTIAQVLSGSISGYPNITMTGTALPASGTTNFISISGGNLVLNIFNSTGAPVLTIDPPVLTPAPPAVIYVTESFSLTSAAYGVPPLSYQWRLNGTNISGATGTTFSKSNATTNNSGNYVVVVTNPYGSTTSSVPTTVTVLNPAVSLTSGLNLWLKFDETTGLTAYDSSGKGLNGTLQGFAGDDSQWVAGRLGGAINVNPYSGEQEVVAVQDNGSLNFSTNMEFSLAAWVNPATSQTSGAAIIAKGFGAGGEEYVLDVNGGTYRFYVRNAGALATVYQTSAAPDGYWHQLTAVFSVPKSRVLVYLDGNVILTGTPPASLLNITNEVDIGARMSGTNTQYDLDLNAILDDVRIYNRVLAPTEVAALYGLAPSVAPTLVSSPVSRSVFPGGSCTFSAPAAGTLPLRYQWQYGTTNISGATNSSYVVTNVQAGNVGNYTVTVTNIAGSTGATATLALLPTPTGNYETWVVGDQPEAYWRLDDTTSPILDSMGRHDGLPYSLGAVDSGLTYFSVGQPGALINNADTSMYFYSGYQNKVVVPYSSNLNSVPFTIECWAQFSGSSSLTTYYSPVSSLAASGGDQGYLLYAAADSLWESWLGEGGTSWSFNQGTSVQPNAWTHLVATFDGTNNCIYVNGVLSQSKTVTAFFQNLTSSFNIGCNGAQNGYYFNGYIDEVAFYKSALSAARIAAHYNAAVYGGSVPPVVIAPNSQTVVVGSTVTFTASAGGSPLLTYQWQKNGTSISGATNLSLILTNVYYTDAAQYTLAVTNGAGGVVGAAATLTVMPTPTFANLTNNLVLHLKFDGNYADSSGLGNNGVSVNSPSFVAGKIGSQAVQVSSAGGTYNYVTVSDPNNDLHFAAGQDFTVAMWVKVPSGSVTELPFFGNQDASLLSTIAGYSFSPTTSGGWGYYIQDDGGNFVGGSSSTSIADNQWHNLVYSAQRSGNVNVYLDGHLSGSSSMASVSNSITPSYAANVGQDGPGNYNVTATYTIDDLGVWQRALTSYDALSLYTAGASGQSFDVYGPVSMALQQSGSSLKITWQAGTLQSAANINGPWTAVSGAAAPYYTITPGTGNMFFRIKL